MTKLHRMTGGKPFQDNGTSPVTCGRMACIMKASKIGWGNLSVKRSKDAGLGIRIES